MTNVFAISVLALMSACASQEVPRTKFSDARMRIMIDPASVEVEQHVRVQSALVASEKWVVVDRSSGLLAIAREQQMLHRSAIDRFEDKEKYAHWGKLYGVGAVVVAHAQCQVKDYFMLGDKVFCNQFLNLVDANTGEIIVAVEAENHAGLGETPDWNEAVKKLNAAYPASFKVFHEHEKLLTYKAESKEAAQRQREVATEEGALQ